MTRKQHEAKQKTSGFVLTGVVFVAVLIVGRLVGSRSEPEASDQQQVTFEYETIPSRLKASTAVVAVMIFVMPVLMFYAVFTASNVLLVISVAFSLFLIFLAYYLLHPARRRSKRKQKTI
ncbi:MAG: hypothetical protein KC546_21115 [Anaerolineae bacterium]|nr:hypothetical protein [Anaerolineae bacterium]MCA9890897.1 hypothetical protein [Anaerolineae bacterium]